MIVCDYCGKASTTRVKLLYQAEGFRCEPHELDLCRPCKQEVEKRLKELSTTRFRTEELR